MYFHAATGGLRLVRTRTTVDDYGTRLIWLDFSPDGQYPHPITLAFDRADAQQLVAALELELDAPSHADADAGANAGEAPF